MMVSLLVPPSYHAHTDFVHTTYSARRGSKGNHCAILTKVPYMGQDNANAMSKLASRVNTWLKTKFGPTTTKRAMEGM